MRYKLILQFLVLIVGVMGCQSIESAGGPELSQTSIAETLLPLPPTDQPESAAPSRIPPPDTQVSTGPVISLLEEQRILGGEQFVPISLDEYILDEDHHPGEITWSHSGEKDLKVRITRRVLIVSPPSSGWTGSEIIVLQACDPDEQCAEMEVIYTVERVNHPPELSKIDDQLIFPGEIFREVMLDDYLSDPDNQNSEITWSYSGNSSLDILFESRTASVMVPNDAWRGPETIRFTACDPEGLCASDEVIYQVQDKADLKITFIANAGFLIEAGDKKIAIDALLQQWDGYQSLAYADVLRMENSNLPFDGIDLVIVTHDHFDHYNSEVLGTYLENNPSTIVLSTQDVSDDLQERYDGFEGIQDRVVGIKVKDGEHSKMIIKGIGLELMNFPHGPGSPHNLGVVISIGGFRILHTGDLTPDETPVVFSQYAIPERNIDVALVPAFWMFLSRYHHFITEIKVPYIVPMHFDPATSNIIDDMQVNFPDTVIFQNIYDTWELSH